MEYNSKEVLALLPCPVKVPIEMAFQRFLQKKKYEERASYYLMESNAVHHTEYFESIQGIQSVEEIPKVILSPGFNGFLHKKFIDRFVKLGHFKDVSHPEVSSTFKNFTFKDPNGYYTMLSMNPLVMVVDHTQLGNRKVPERWEDLLQPEFEKKVVIRGKSGLFCETVLMSFYQLFGKEAVEKLGKAVQAGWHPAQMAKMAGTGKEGSPIVTVMPYFYSHTIKNKDKVSIIWPKEGGFVNPVFMLVQQKGEPEIQDIAEFFIGEEVAKIFADAYFPSVHPQVENQIPMDAPLHWLGWDFVQEYDIEQLILELNKLFIPFI